MSQIKDVNFVAAYDKAKKDAQSRNQIFVTPNGDPFVTGLTVTQIVNEDHFLTKKWDTAKKAIIYEERIVVLRNQETKVGDVVNIGMFLACKDVPEFKIKANDTTCAKFLAVPA